MLVLKILTVATLLFGVAALWADLGNGARRRLRKKSKADMEKSKFADPLPGGQYKATDWVQNKITDRVQNKPTSPTQKEVTVLGLNDRPRPTDYTAHYEEGAYRCSCCNSELFSSVAKLHSDNGGPCFQNPIEPGSISLITDISYGVIRTGIICSSCEAHLGYRFLDGPESSGVRYCIDSTSLQFYGKTSA